MYVLLSNAIFAEINPNKWIIDDAEAGGACNGGLLFAFAIPLKSEHEICMRLVAQRQEQTICSFIAATKR